MSRTHGLCIYVKAEREAELRKVYAYVQSTPLGEIRAMQLWNVVLAYQFVVHISVTSESLAETVGSFLHNLEQKAFRQPLSDANLALRTSLKAAGMRGLGGEDAIMDAALCRHFDSRDPALWHFTHKTGSKAIDTAPVQAIQTVRAPAAPLKPEE